ncbi:hypothetical protein [Burkholderia sp. S171]|uniref:hypothetical protein n=1 Tax=Burkholderia sp. S171 TaxID=1641860 RepID=UPI00131A6F4C|nr:hypothetical protein [Burkholderia sp. S171]
MPYAFSPSSSSRFEGSFESSFEEWLPGLELTHTLHVTSSPDLDAVTSVLGCIKDDQDAIESWTITRRGTVLDQRITLRGISEGEVRLLRERLTQLDKKLKVRLEHQCNRRLRVTSK